MIAAFRLLVAVAQGLTLWWLHDIARAAHWLADDRPLFMASLTAALFVPLILVAAIGNLRSVTLAIWIAGSFVLFAGLGFHAGFRQSPIDRPSVVLTGIFFLDLTALFFVAHALISAGDADRQWIARFATYFEIAWKLAMQVAFGLVFVGVLWGILWLGTELFEAIGIEEPATIIGRNWFWIPATTLAVAISLHLTDAGGPMIRGPRTLLLGMLSGLMSIMVAIAFAFLAALAFTGLEPLWKTGHATASLLAASALLVLLINAHFQDGDDANRSIVLRYARLVAAVLLAPLTALAATGLGLRVAQHGWTPTRVFVCAAVIVVACHAIGYLWTAVRSGIALRGLPMTNVVSALVAVVVIVALLTPVADPARLSVNDQLARLRARRIEAAAFDYDLLRYKTGLYGVEALRRLRDQQEGPLPAEVARRATEAFLPPH